MPRVLRDREFTTLQAVSAGRVHRLRTTGRYAIRGGRREKTVTVAARALAAAGLITVTPLVPAPGYLTWERAALTAMGALALERETTRRRLESEATPAPAGAENGPGDAVGEGVGAPRHHGIARGDLGTQSAQPDTTTEKDPDD